MVSPIDPTIRSQRWRQYRARRAHFGTWSDKHHFRLVRAREVLDQLARVVERLDSLEWTPEDAARLAHVQHRVARLTGDAQCAAIAEALGRPVAAGDDDGESDNPRLAAGAA